MSKYIFLSLLGIVLAAGPAGCTLAPKYTRPEAPVPGRWPDGDAYRGVPAADGAAATAELPWREFFTDPSLQQVIGTALANNRDLRLAALNVEMARALYGIQRQELYPTLYATGGGGKQRASADLTGLGQPRTTEQYNANLGILSWELDFFGRVRSLKDEALETYLATREARRGAQVLLVSAVANAYLALAADREGLALAENTLKSQQSSYELVRRQHELGVATELDLRRVEITLETARGEMIRYTRQAAQSENALAFLVGAPVPPELLPAELGRIRPPRELAPALPSAVLLARPDISEAEHQLMGAHAFIGAARAAFFPSISLTTALGTASNELAGLFKSGTGTWNYSAQLAMPIFDARTWSAYRVSNVQREMALLRYERAIQNAFREVADALAVRGTVDRQLAAQQALVAALSETHRLAQFRFERGVDSYLGVLDAQRSLFGAQQGLVSLRLAQLASQVQLYAALGGGGLEEPAAPAAE
ncbi:MAG: efflux transporter outer membrane subunit [Lentisphaeria bacterium]|nr:efflux transporter outer membrane subunit [Lentisphaeria bacterium]